MALEKVRASAGKFQSRIRIRNMIEYVAAAVVIAAFGWHAWNASNPMAQWGAILVIPGALFIVWQLHVRGGARRAPDASAASVLDFHRGELVRQRDMFRSAWLWYLMPMAPGLVLMLASWFVFTPASPVRSLAEQRVGLGFMSVIVLLVFLVAFLVHRIAAYRLQKQIDDLDALTRG